MQLTTGVQAIGVSPLLLSIRILIPVINSAITPEECRTLVVYYHNDTTEVATEIFLAVGELKAPIISINIDNKNTIPYNSTNNDMGSHLYNICVMENIDMLTPQNQRTLQCLDRHAKNFYFMVVQESATQQEISAFFENLWTEYRMLSVVAFFLGESIQAYTHFPYKNQFAIKIDEFHSSNITQAHSTLLTKYFLRKADDLENMKINVYTSENMPKAFRVPSKYRRLRDNFYFVGRDGIMVKVLASAMNVQWQYKSLDDSQVTKIANFMVNDGPSTTEYGIPIDFDDKNPSNLEYRTLSDGEPIT